MSEASGRIPDLRGVSDGGRAEVPVADLIRVIRVNRIEIVSSKRTPQTVSWGETDSSRTRVASPVASERVSVEFASGDHLALRVHEARPGHQERGDEPDEGD